MSVPEGVEEIRARVAAAAERAGRDRGEVRIVAVTKGVPLERVRQAVASGVADLGESRAQDLREKSRNLEPDLRWHFLGGLQTNKVRYLDDVHLMHSLDRPQEAEALQRRSEVSGRTWDVLVEVSLAGEPTKQGIPPDELGAFLGGLGSWPSVRARGLMVVAPRCDDPEEVRWVFAEARRLRDRHRETVGGLEELSMGMTDDFEVAIEEGSTIVRIGRALFARERLASRPRPSSQTGV